MKWNRECCVFLLVVLSSDDEDEGENSCEVPQRCSQGVHTLASVEDAEIQAKSPQEAKQQEAVSDSEDTEVGMCSFCRQTFQSASGKIRIASILDVALTALS